MLLVTSKVQIPSFQNIQSHLPPSIYDRPTFLNLRYHTSVLNLVGKRFGSNFSIANPTLSKPTTLSSNAHPFIPVIHHMTYDKVFSIKKDRFGTVLQQFKTLYEEPFVKIFEQAQNSKDRQFKKIRNWDSHKARRSRVRERRKIQVEKEIEIDQNELLVQEELTRTLDEKEVTLGHFLTSSDKRVKELLGKNPIDSINLGFDAFDQEAIESDKWWSTGYLNAAFMPNKLKMHPERWHWEKHLPLNEWLKVISSEILAAGLPLREDMKILEGSLEYELVKEFEEQGKDKENAIQPANIKNAFSTNYVPVDVESPAVIKVTHFSDKTFLKKKKHITFNDHHHPFVLETTSVPILDSMKSHSNRIPVDFLQRKAKLTTHIHRLGLPDTVLKRLIQLAGSHYNPKARIMSISSWKKPSMNENIGNLYKIMRALLNEAWKADLNYIPPSQDPLNPHLLVEQEIFNQKANEDEGMDPQLFLKSNQYVFFRVSTLFPHPESLQEDLNQVQKIEEEIKGLVSGLS